MFQKIFSLTLKLNKNYKRFPLNICANILIIILDDEDLYSATEINKGKTGQINNIILDILPTIYDLLKNSDTLRDSLSFLSLIIERNSAFIKQYRSVGIINEIITKHIDEVTSYDFVAFNPLRDEERKTEQIAINILAQIINAANYKSKLGKVERKY